MLRTVADAMKKHIRKLLLGLGYKIYRSGGPLDRSTMDGAFRALVGRQHSIGTVIDIGASNGSWSEALMRHLPSCRYLLVEAQPVHEPALRKFCARHANAQFVLAAAGEREGRIHFDASEPLSGQASNTPFPSNDIEVPVITLDAVLRARKLAGPYLLKFDTHGYEIPILNGAVETLARTDVIIMECYNFRIAPECLTFDEMCRYLADRGFRCIDLVGPMHRPRDDAFWQMDLVFVRSDRPEFGYTGYR
jgi:FkbM family methyltransferase